MTPVHEWQLDTRCLGQRVLVYDLIDSTNSRCADFADDPQNAGLVLLAHAQTAGRGQYGRRWSCEPGTGVLLSALLFPPVELRRPVLLTAWAAVSVCDLIEACTGLTARIKWPNDVLIEGRKVCGILIEQKRGVIAGIGLNLNQGQESFLAEGLHEAGSLRLFTDRDFDVEETARQLIEKLDQNYHHLQTGNVAELQSRWRERIGLVGEEVLIEEHGTNHTGRLMEVCFDAVVLESDSGEPLLLRPEMVKHIFPLAGSRSR